MSNKNVLLADASYTIRLRLKEIVKTIHTHYRFWDDGGEVLTSLKQNTIDLLMININFPSSAAVEIHQRLIFNHRHLKIIAYTFRDDNPWAVSLYQSAVLGIINLNAPEKELKAPSGVCWQGIVITSGALIRNLQNFHKDLSGKWNSGLWKITW